VPRIFIHATNVHSGGGKALLLALLSAVKGRMELIAVLDSRMLVPENGKKDLQVRFTKPSIWHRLQAECWLRRNVGPEDVVLCFGNLPPLFKLAGHVVVFIQNRYLVDRVALAAFPFKTRLRLSGERFWLSRMAANANAFIVQTPSMAALVKSSVAVDLKSVYVLPFTNDAKGYRRELSATESSVARCTNIFLYVASGEPHKNHLNLIKAWCILAKQDLFPVLWLTLDAENNHDLCVWMERQKSLFDLQLVNLGTQPHEQIMHLYTQVQALIYPSTFESFGLPLIEARQAGLAVIASEQDFVRDVLDPEEVFDPQSPLSIARAVKRFMGSAEKALPLLNATEFLNTILEKCK
jgi:glycosyltransferase involved in cell wall biosynthesis